MVTINSSRSTNYSTPENKDSYYKCFDTIREFEKDIVQNTALGALNNKKVIQLWFSDEGSLQGFVDGGYAYEWVNDHFESCGQGRDFVEYLDAKFNKTHPDVSIIIDEKNIIVDSDNQFGDITHFFLNKFLNCNEVKKLASALGSAKNENAALAFTSFVYVDKESKALV